MIRRAAALLLLLVAACAATPMEWQRDETSAAQREQDQRQCAEEGDRRAFDESFRPRVYFTLPVPTVQSPSYFERSQDVHRLAADCMRRRGYRLVPKVG